jgi:hypothetical protein
MMNVVHDHSSDVMPATARMKMLAISLLIAAEKVSPKLNDFYDPGQQDSIVKIF